MKPRAVRYQGEGVGERNADMRKGSNVCHGQEGGGEGL